MDYHSLLHPCPACRQDMTIKSVQACAFSGVNESFYFIYCPNCGQGPLTAYPCVYESIIQWNEKNNTY